MAVKAYTNPGVNVQEEAGPVVAPTISTPSIVAIIGEARGTQSASERLILSGTTPITLRYTGVDENSVQVALAATGEVINPGNYTVTQSTDPDATITGDEPTTVARNVVPTVAPTIAAAGTGTLTGTYRYTYSWVNAGGETAPSPNSASVAITGAGYNLSAIAIGPTGTTARNIYRESVVGGIGQGYHLVATIADNVTTVLTNETTSDVTANAAPGPKSGIASGDTVVVSYTYADQNYFEPTLFDDYDSLVDKYGSPWDANGNIDNPLSLAARLAFLNGARTVMGVATTTSNPIDLEDALLRLENEEEIDFVVVASGDTEIIASEAAHASTMNQRGFYRSTVVGQDGSTTTVTAPTLRLAAQAFDAEYVQYISPASFRIRNPVTGRENNVGAHYMAAAIAGQWAGKEVRFPLTRATVAGFTGINDKRNSTERALDSQSGLLVIMEPSPGVLTVRHSITTAIGDLNKREGSVVRGKYELARRIRLVLDGLIGLVAPIQEAPAIVAGAAVGVLNQLVSEQVINGYGSLKSRLLAGDPTTCEVRFSYTPFYPINNIDVIFTINTNTGDFIFTTP